MASILTSRNDYSDLDIDELVDKLTPGTIFYLKNLCKKSLLWILGCVFVIYAWTSNVSYHRIYYYLLHIHIYLRNFGI